MVIFPGTDLESAAAVAERLRKLIENTRFVYHKQEISFSVSIGVTEIRDSDQSQETVFNRVDKAMYKAKKTGRNMVAII
jgi:diguanylate cyclase (GGDEF)-like protein